MKQQNKLAPFENLLLAYITSQTQNNGVAGTPDKEAEVVFEKQYDKVLSKEKTASLLAALTESLSKDSLGSLVQKGLTASVVRLSELQDTTGLTPSLLEDIKKDMIFTNSVPVKSLVKLLKLLNISIEKAHEAIQTTFEKLSTESKMFLSIPTRTQPAFRKGESHNDINFDFKRLRSDESYLYQNRDALDKYTKRLTELYNEL